MSLPKTIRDGIAVLAVDNEAAVPMHGGIDTSANYPGSGKLFVLSFPYEGIFLKRLFFNQKDECVVLRAGSPAYVEIGIQADLADQILRRLVWVMQEV